MWSSTNYEIPHQESSPFLNLISSIDVHESNIYTYVANQQMHNGKICFNI